MKVLNRTGNERGRTVLEISGWKPERHQGRTYMVNRRIGELEELE